MLSGCGIYIEVYADDFCLFAVGKFPNTMSGLTQWALLTVQTRCNEVGLLLYPNKTELVVFTRKKKHSGFFEPKFFSGLL
jgi:hypothetical protein